MQSMKLIARLSIGGILMASTLGCAATTKRSRVPEFIERLKQHQFSQPERVVIGDILHYVNELESK
jgi:hypothetical protein